ncbi:MAG: DUF3427 domain-containing protein [Thermoanaerobaculia bacterium]
MPRKERGLYEIVVTEALNAGLQDAPDDMRVRRRRLRDAEAADRISLHLSRVMERAIEALAEDDRAVVGISLARKLIDVIGQEVSNKDFAAERPMEPGEILEAILARLPDGRSESITEPLIPLLDTTLLTNAPGEPRVGSQILTEIYSADRIDVVMAFIRRSGIAPMLEALRAHCGANRAFRVLTTTYTGSTEARALDQLCAAGADVRVSYDTESTRLHAKAWLFHRQSGFSTAYIGSSNLTHSAQVSGLEWNIRMSAARNRDVVDKFAAVFESYWSSGDFIPYEREHFLRKIGTTQAIGPVILLSPTEVRPEPFQERLLELIALSRQQGHHRNLLVSATGTGKTVMAALDYARLRETIPHARLLFVAHREEILLQSMATFRQALRDHSFGELWVGRNHPTRFEHVFASIQSINRTGLAHLAPEQFEVVVVDEFHHAAAASYRALLDHVRPVELLGLTATPERSDGLPILDWFDGRIAAELRLWDAIDQHRLVPFTYYGIHDGMDLRAIPWRRGVGYDVSELSNLLTGNEAWAGLVLKEIDRRVEDVSLMRALGFCVSVEHARFMARLFCQRGIAAIAIWSDTPEEERGAALVALAKRDVNVVFSVDLFNEGIDVASVDTLLMLRPTESPTLFLQQLGRGLRKSRGKPVCTVLDFVGHHRKEFRFDRRLRALLGGSRSDVATQVQQGFPFLPAGCHMSLDAVAREIVLASIRAAVPSQWTQKVSELRNLARDARTYPLAKYIEETGLDLEDVYTGNKGWSDMCTEAGLATHPPGPKEDILRRACGRLLHIDDVVRIDAYLHFLSSESVPVPEVLSNHERRLLRMLIASVAGRALEALSLNEGCALVWRHRQILSELKSLLEVLRHRISHVPTALSALVDVPLQVHARYTRVEILAAFDVGENARVAAWQTGVYWAREARADLLAFTLDKTSGGFSPTTRYRDFAISRDLIHWESQSVVRSDSETGKRYQHHQSLGTSVMLFARLRSDDRSFYFLGPASYVKHESELPMAVTWRLDHTLPGDLFAAFAAAVA